MDFFNPLGQDNKLSFIEEHDKQKDNVPYDYDLDKEEREKLEKAIAAQSGSGSI